MYFMISSAINKHKHMKIGSCCPQHKFVSLESLLHVDCRSIIDLAILTNTYNLMFSWNNCQAQLKLTKNPTG